MQYTSCFVGIPLPDKFQEEFENTLDKVKKLYPNWQLAYPKTPHITIYYLDKQSQHFLPEIANVVSTKAKFSKKISLIIKNFDFFAKRDPRQGIVFLNIKYPSDLKNYNQQLATRLSSFYTADNNLPFHPHITVARVNEPKKDTNLSKSVKLLNSKIARFEWKFTVEEIAIYGVNSTTQPQNQKKLISLKLN